MKHLKTAPNMVDCDFHNGNNQAYDRVAFVAEKYPELVEMYRTILERLKEGGDSGNGMRVVKNPVNCSYSSIYLGKEGDKVWGYTLGNPDDMELLRQNISFEFDGTSGKLEGLNYKWWERYNTIVNSEFKKTTFQLTEAHFLNTLTSDAWVESVINKSLLKLLSGIGEDATYDHFIKFSNGKVYITLPFYNCCLYTCQTYNKYPIALSSIPSSFLVGDNFADDPDSSRTSALSRKEAFNDFIYSFDFDTGISVEQFKDKYFQEYIKLCDSIIASDTMLGNFCKSAGFTSENFLKDKYNNAWDIDNEDFITLYDLINLPLEELNTRNILIHTKISSAQMAEDSISKFIEEGKISEKYSGWKFDTVYEGSIIPFAFGYSFGLSIFIEVAKTLNALPQDIDKSKITPNLNKHCSAIFLRPSTRWDFYETYSSMLSTKELSDVRFYPIIPHPFHTFTTLNECISLSYRDLFEESAPFKLKLVSVLGESGFNSSENLDDADLSHTFSSGTSIKFYERTSSSMFNNLEVTYLRISGVSLTTYSYYVGFTGSEDTSELPEIPTTTIDFSGYALLTPYIPKLGISSNALTVWDKDKTSFRTLSLSPESDYTVLADNGIGYVQSTSTSNSKIVEQAIAFQG